MGGAGSVANCESLSAEQVGDLVASIGPKFEPYRCIFIENGVCGEVLKSTEEAELQEMLKDLGVDNKWHLKTLLTHFRKIAGDEGGEEVRPVEGTSKSSSSSSSAAPSTVSTNFKEHDVVVGEKVTLPPRTIMTRLFEVQGIPLDPSEIEVTVEKIKKVVGTGFGDGQNRYDCFINYRVAADADVAEKLYLYLKTAGVHAFLDRKCLKNGEKWKDGFLNGLKRSKHFVALVSRAALAKVRDHSQDHAYDNVLLEYETALKIMTDTKNPNFICPVHVAENTIMPSLNQVVLVKFADFNPNLYPESIAAVDKEAAQKQKEEDAKKAAEAKKVEREAAQRAAAEAAKAEKEEAKRVAAAAAAAAENDEEEQEQVEDSDEEDQDAWNARFFQVRDKPDAEITEVDVMCPQCEECHFKGPKQLDETLPSWSCDWPTHEGENDFTNADDVYGCDTLLDCDFAICGACFAKLQTACNEASDVKNVLQPEGSVSKHVDDASSYIEFPIVGASKSEDDKLKLLIQFNARGGEEGMPDYNTCQLHVGDKDILLPTTVTNYTKDEFQVTGLLTYELDSEYSVSALGEAVYIDAGNDSFTKVPLEVPWATFEHEMSPYVPTCNGGGDHAMVISDYTGGAYDDDGYVCDKCMRHLDRERWWCKVECSDMCFQCRAVPPLYPRCENGHKMERWPQGKMPPHYYDVECDSCARDSLYHNTEYFHCPECGGGGYDLCLSCAQQTSAGIDPAEYSVEELDKQNIGLDGSAMQMPVGSDDEDEY